MFGDYSANPDRGKSDAGGPGEAGPRVEGGEFPRLNFGGERTGFDFHGCAAFVIAPTRPAADRSRPWVWYAPTINRHPADVLTWLFGRLLDEGFHLAGINVGDTYANPE